MAERIPVGRTPVTLSFHKVMFDAQEVLDLIQEVGQEHENCDCDGLVSLETAFCEKAEERSRTEHKV